MKVNREICSRCGKMESIVPSNNPLVKGIGVNCINEVLDAAKVEHFVFFCRTYNLPLNLNVYMVLYKESRNNVFARYVETLLDDGKLKFEDKTGDLWPDIEREWAKVKTYTDIMLKIPAIRESFTERSTVKWGMGYTFNDLIQLENLLVNTIKVYNIADPMRLDAIKKACKLSVKIDSLIESGDAKSIKDYTGAYKDFLKAAQIDELGQTASEGTIKTVSDLFKYLEKKGFEPEFYDHEERDIVDKTINDIKASIRQEIGNATGLDFKLEEIKKSMNRKIEDDITKEVLDDRPLSELIGAQDYYEEVEKDVDEELDKQELDLEYLEED